MTVPDAKALHSAIHWARLNHPCTTEMAALILAAEAQIKSGWQPIETAPKDGAWFMIGRAGEGPETYEIGRFDPYCMDSFVEVEGGLYRKEQQKILDWRGFNNFHRATHWMPLPLPPAPKGGGE